MMDQKKSSIPMNVWILGLVSFFNDVASEMIYPIVPLFLTTTLHAPIAALGLIEGIAEATAAIMKFVSGYWSDRMQKRKPFVTAGYSLAALSKILIGLATAWPFVLLARIVDRLGKGVRTSARDALLLQNTTPENKGYIFGIHRSLDSAGAVVGPLIALLIINFYTDNLRLVFLLAAIPAFVGVLLLYLLVKEKHENKKNTSTPLKLSWKGLDKRFKLFLLISLLFAVGNSADSFIILRANNLGMTTQLTVLAYVLYNLVQTAAATPAGRLADKIGARKVFTYGLLIFALVYLGFGRVTDYRWIWFLFPIYGMYIAFTDGVSKAYIAEFATQKNAGSYFGIYQTGLALCTFIASFVGGILWSSIHPAATFYFGSLMAAISFTLLLIYRSSL